MLTHIDLFSGIGGFALAAQWAGFKTVAFVEIEPYAQEIIKERFGTVADTGCSVGNSSRNGDDKRRTGTFTASSQPILYGDIFAFSGTAYCGATLLTGGFPCQPFSQAGKRRGKEDDRYLWPEMLRVIHEARPAWVLGENVAGIVTMELDRVLSDLEGEGYAVQPLVIPACAVDAKHRRDRVWIVGYAERTGQQGREWSERTGRYELNRPDSLVGYAEDGRIRRWETSGSSGQPAQPSQDVSNNDNDGQRQETDAGTKIQSIRRATTTFDSSNWWLPEPDVGRVAHGIPARVDRLKGLGNSIVPQAAYEIIKVIAEIETTAI